MSAGTIGSLFSGVGGLDLAVEASFGARTVWQCELDPNASKVLAHHYPDTPNHGDITEVDWSKVEPVDILCGGFPCQDISSAGKGAGIKEGTRSGLWYRYADAIRVLRPRLVVVENVSALLVRGLDVVAGSLAEIGYDIAWTCLRASDVGACHRRERLFLVAWPAVDADGWRRGRRGAGEPTTAGDGREDGVGWPAGAGSDAGPLTLLPTPSAANPNDGEDLDGWTARRERVKEEIGNGNGFGMPLSIAVRLLPTPTTEPATGNGHARNLAAEVDPDRWGQYAPAIARHEAVAGRPAPDSTDSKGRLSPRFVEWVMMLPEGWVTDHLGRGHALRALGNGVVPAQASAALSLLLPAPILAEASR